MKNKKFVFGLVAFVMLATMGFAYSLLPQATLNETQVMIQTADDNDALLKISVLAFEPAKSDTGTTASQLVQQWYQECGAEANVQDCIRAKAIEANSQAVDYQFNISGVKDAHITVEYFNPMGNAYQGMWSPVPGCEDKVADQAVVVPATDTKPSYTYYYAECNIEGVAQRGTTHIRATFVPTSEQAFSSSSNTYEYVNAQVTGADQFAQSIQDMVAGVGSGGAGIASGGSLPCMGVFMILGLLLASLYFSGKSPVTLLDITTPRLPTPKGVTAGGQILAPFGYSEMKKTTGAKMKAGAAAAAVTTGILRRRMRGDAGVDRALATVAAAKGTAADRAAGGAPAGLKQQKEIASAFVVGAREAGFKGDALKKLANLPYHWGDAEHQQAAQVLAALEAKGGRHALLAMNLKDYLYSMRTFQTLEALTGHKGLGKRSAFHYRVTGTMGKFYGSGRYQHVSSVVMSGTDSIARSARMMGRMGKAAVTMAPEMARSSAKTTMAMLGGKHTMERMQQRAKTSGTAAWLTKQAKKSPHRVEVGQMFPVSDKMGHLYQQLGKEARRDQMRYVLRQLYKKMGLKFNVSSEELASMGHKDIDILKRSGFKASPELTHLEAQMKAIISDHSKTGQQRLTALIELAEKNGAKIDHQMLAFNEKMQAIETSAHPDYDKHLQLTQLLEEQNHHVKQVMNSGGMIHDDAYVCHVGGDSLREHQIWETMVLRTMVYDWEHGYDQGGIKEAAVSARVNLANRLTSLDPTSAIHELPEHMRNEAELKKVAERNRQDLISLLSDEGKQSFQRFSEGKPIQSASIGELVKFMSGGEMSRLGDIDPKTGRMTWRASDLELQLPKSHTLVDMKRHWVSELKSAESIAIGQWVEGRFTRSYVPPYKESIEAQLDRMPGSSSWSVDQRTQASKKLWVLDQLHMDTEQRFNSQFAKNAYGTTRETNRFYGGIVSGFLEKAMEEKGLSNNHPDRTFLTQMDMTNSKHIGRLRELMETHKEHYNEVINRPMTYDGITSSKQAVVMLHEGGFAYYNKGMMLSDQDRVMAGETALRDDKGIMRKFIAEEVTVGFGSRNDLMSQYGELRFSKDVNKWKPFVESATHWAKDGGYSYEKEKVLAAVLWNYGQQTHDYSSFWQKSAVSVQNKTHVAPVAPSPLRFFGVDGHKGSEILKPFRDIGRHGGDYISKVALAAGGDVHRTSYDIAPVSSQMRMQSFKTANAIQSGEILKGLTEEEKVAYRAVANQHGAYIQVWQYAVDRNPWRQSTSFGTQQAWGSKFNFGPGIPFDVKHNLRAYMGKGEYAAFRAHAGPLDTAGKIMTPYATAVRSMQMSMQGYASRFDLSQDSLREYNYTQPRLQEAMQGMNPFSASWGHGKAAQKLKGLNKMESSLEQRQLSGANFNKGLSAGPSDVMLQKKGIYSNVRLGDANPGETYYDYRMTLRADPAMAEYLFRTKDASFMHDQDVRNEALSNTTRRTVSAEALAIKRDQEIRGFGVMQNSLFGWANPVAFLWHMPVPGFPQSLSPKEMVANRVARSKQGYGQSFGDRMKGMAQGTARGTSRMFQPHKLSMVVYCPKCGMSNFRGSVCKSAGCGTTQY